MLLWLNGGPGRLSTFGALLENGPYEITANGTRTSGGKQEDNDDSDNDDEESNGNDENDNDPDGDDNDDDNADDVEDYKDNNVSY